MKDIVLIVGGGIAGMESARQLNELGMSPVIVEKSSSLGGHVAGWNHLFPDMTPAHKVLDPYETALKDTEVHLETTIASINKLQKGFSVILSDGSAIPCKAVVFATGFNVFNAEKKEEYGYGVYDHVITNRDLENWFNTGSDARVPDKPCAIGFVHCVGSRDIKAGNTQCSKVCCITAIKQVMQHPQDYGFHLRKCDLYPPLPYITTTLSGQNVDLYEFALKNKTTYKMLRELNPWLNNDKIVNKAGKTYTVRIPIANGTSLKKTLSDEYKQTTLVSRF